MSVLADLLEAAGTVPPVNRSDLS